MELGRDLSARLASRARDTTEETVDEAYVHKVAQDPVAFAQFVKSIRIEEVPKLKRDLRKVLLSQGLEIVIVEDFCAIVKIDIPLKHNIGILTVCLVTICLSSVFSWYLIMALVSWDIYYHGILFGLFVFFFLFCAIFFLGVAAYGLVNILRPKVRDRKQIAWDPLRSADALYESGVEHAEKRKYDEAVKKFNESLRTYRELGDRLGMAVTLGEMGSVAENKGALELAEKYYEQSRRIFKMMGARRLMKFAKINLERVRQGISAQRHRDER